MFFLKGGGGILWGQHDMTTYLRATINLLGHLHLKQIFKTYFCAKENCIQISQGNPCVYSQKTIT